MVSASNSSSRLRSVIVCTIFCALAITVLVYFFKTGIPNLRQEQFENLRPPSQPPSSPALEESINPSDELTDNLISLSEWSFDFRKDSDTYGLTTNQCFEAFPLLYQEIDRAVNYRQRVGNVTEKDVEDAWLQNDGVRVLIYNNQLFVLNAHGISKNENRLRSLATLSSLSRALVSSRSRLPNVEFAIAVGDAPQGNALAYARRSDQENLWLVPGYGFWSSPSSGVRSYSIFQTNVVDAEIDFLDKIQKLIWRGSQDDLVETGVRDALIKESNETSWSDVKPIRWSNERTLRKDFIPMEDHCRYMFAAETGDNAHNGRLKYLLNCNNIVITHAMKGIEHFHHLLDSSGEDQNYVKVRSDFSDLKKTMSNLLEPSFLETKGRTIAENARRLFRERYLTPAAEVCYWRALIRAWASVQGFEPQLWVESEESDWFLGVVDSDGLLPRRKPRGVPFESYLLMEEVQWDLPVENLHICVGS